MWGQWTKWNSSFLFFVFFFFFFFFFFSFRSICSSQFSSSSKAYTHTHRYLLCKPGKQGKMLQPFFFLSRFIIAKTLWMYEWIENAFTKQSEKILRVLHTYTQKKLECISATIFTRCECDVWVGVCVCVWMGLFVIALLLNSI